MRKGSKMFLFEPTKLTLSCGHHKGSSLLRSATLISFDHFYLVSYFPSRLDWFFALIKSVTSRFFEKKNKKLLKVTARFFYSQRWGKRGNSLASLLCLMWSFLLNSTYHCFILLLNKNIIRKIVRSGLLCWSLLQRS